MVTIASWVGSSFKFPHIFLKIGIWKRDVFPEFPIKVGFFCDTFVEGSFHAPHAPPQRWTIQLFPQEEPWCLRPSPPTVARLVGIEGGSARNPASAHPSYVTVRQRQSTKIVHQMEDFPKKERPNLANSRHPKRSNSLIKGSILLVNISRSMTLLPSKVHDQAWSTWSSIYE